MLGQGQVHTHVHIKQQTTTTLFKCQQALTWPKNLKISNLRSQKLACITLAVIMPEQWAPCHVTHKMINQDRYSLDHPYIEVKINTKCTIWAVQVSDWKVKQYKNHPIKHLTAFLRCYFHHFPVLMYIHTMLSTIWDTYLFSPPQIQIQQFKSSVSAPYFTWCKT